MYIYFPFCIFHFATSFPHLFTPTIELNNLLCMSRYLLYTLHFKLYWKQSNLQIFVKYLRIAKCIISQIFNVEILVYMWNQSDSLYTYDKSSVIENMDLTMVNAIKYTMQVNDKQTYR